MNDAKIIDDQRKVNDEIERLQKYEKLVMFIAYDYHELSYDKVKWQRDDWKNRCKKLIEKEVQELEELKKEKNENSIC